MNRKWNQILVLVLLACMSCAVSAQVSIYRVHGPLEDFLDTNDRFLDTDLLTLLLGNQRREHLLEPDTITDLDRIRNNASTFQAVDVLFIGRFHRIGTLFNPFYTPFAPEEHINFSVWSQFEQLWTQEGVLHDYPYCYIATDHPKLDRFLSLERLDTVLFEGVSRSSLGDEPWIEITGFWVLKGNLTSDHTRALRRAEQHVRMGDWEQAAGIYTGLCRENLPDAYGVYAETQAAEALLMSGEYRLALQHIKRAYKQAPRAEDVAKLYEKIKKANAEGGCEGCPPPKLRTQTDQGVGGGLVSPPPTMSTPPASAPTYSPPPTRRPAPTPPPPPTTRVMVTPTSSTPTTVPAPQPAMRSHQPAHVVPAVPPPPPPADLAQPADEPEDELDQDQLDRPGRGY
jgi:hypothetical protein